jgi:hypothetical protein
MSLENVVYAMSNINALAQSGASYINQRQTGVPADYALQDFSYNVFNGAMRNGMAHQIYQGTGSSLGHLVNIFHGYGNPEANYGGTVGLMGAAMLTSPYSYGFSGFGGLGGFVMPPLYGGGYTPGFMPSMFSPCGFYC